ncbi:MAG: hypothetical protein ACM3NO_05450 [Deltaproteobacteria bacterium]
MSLRLHVECYAGHKADERPLRFSFAVPSEPAESLAPPRTYEVKEVLDQWYGLEYQCFKVLADDGNLYILRHDFREEAWTLDSFRSAQR